MTAEQVVFELWCQLTDTDQATFDEPAREAFLARPQVPALARVRYGVLFDAGIGAVRRNSLPLERWLAATRVLDSAGV